MSLRAQFLFSVIVALLLDLAVLGVVACWHAHRSVETEMRTALSVSERIVESSLVSLPSGEGQMRYLKKLVRSFDGDRHVEASLRVGPRLVARSSLATPDKVPIWYQRLLAIPTENWTISSARLKGPVLSLTSDDHNEIAESWVQFRDGAAILALFSLVVLGLLHLVIARISLPLAKLSSGFESLGGGNYAAHVCQDGPREISGLARAFNRMTERLRALEDANRQLTRQMLAIQEEERIDIARDLHDEMGPILFAIRVDAQAIQTQAQKGGYDAIAERARSLDEAANQIQRHVRTMLKQLQPKGLSQAGLGAAIVDLVLFWQRHHPGLSIHLETDAAKAGFGSDADAAIYRVVQEGLTNAVRHAAAKQIWISITKNKTQICVSVEDDGQGFCGGAESDGMGLKSMRERVVALSGVLNVADRSGGGTRVSAIIPHPLVRRQEASAEL